MQKQLVVIGVVVLFALAIGCSENAIMQGDYSSLGVVRPDLIDEIVMQPALIGFDGESICDVVTAGGIKADPVMYLVDKGRLSLSSEDEIQEDIGVTTRNGKLIVLRTAFNVIGNFEAITFGMKDGSGGSESPAGKYHSIYFTYGDVDNDGDPELSFGRDSYFFDATGLWYADRLDLTSQIDETKPTAFQSNETSRVNKFSQVNEMAEGSFRVGEVGRVLVGAGTGVLEGMYDSVHDLMVITDDSVADGSGIGMQFFIREPASETASILGIYNYVKMDAKPEEATFVTSHGQLIFDADSVYMTENSGSGLIHNEDWGTWQFEEADGAHRVNISLPGSPNNGLIGLGTHDGEVLILQNQISDQASLLWAFKAP